MMMTKAHIIDEIERTAEANGGQALGRQRFYAETGIRLVRKVLGSLERCASGGGICSESVSAGIR
jgi:hypothetical protein